MADYVIELGRIGGVSYTVGAAELEYRRAAMSRDLGCLIAMGQELEPVGGGPVPAKPGIFQTILGFLGDGLGVIGDVVGFPLNLIGSGAEFVIKTIADLAKNVPIVGELISDILLAGNTLLQAGLKLPETTLDMLSTLLKSFGGLDKSKQDDLQKKSLEKLTAKARESGQEQDLNQLVNFQKKDSEKAETAATLNKVAGVGAPLAVGTVAFVALQGALGLGAALGVGAGAAGLGLGAAYLLGAFD